VEDDEAEAAGWTLEVEETSAGAYLVTGTDSLGRSVRLRGGEPEPLLAEARRWLRSVADLPPVAAIAPAAPKRVGGIGSRAGLESPYSARMTEDPTQSVAVPALTGLPVPRAHDVGRAAGVIVVSADSDAAPLASLTWPGSWFVTSQDPAAGSRVPMWDTVRVTFRRDDGDEPGDREPRRPPPSPRGLAAHAALPDD